MATNASPSWVTTTTEQQQHGNGSNPALDDVDSEQSSGSEAERPVSLSSQQIHELLQLQDDNDEEKKKESIVIKYQQPIEKKQHDQEPRKSASTTNPADDLNVKQGAKATSLGQQDDDDDAMLKKQMQDGGNNTWRGSNAFVVHEQAKELKLAGAAHTTLAMTQSSNMARQMQALGATASSHAGMSSSSSSQFFTIPPPPTAALHRMSSTPGAFAAGGSLATAPLEHGGVSNPDDPEHENHSHDGSSSVHEPTLVETAMSEHAPEQAVMTTTRNGELLLHATLVTDRDAESHRNDVKPGPVVTAEPLDESALNHKTTPWFHSRLCGISVCVVAILLIVSVTTVTAMRNNDDGAASSNTTQNYWDLDGRFQTATKQAFYVVVFGSATDCGDYTAPALSLQCGSNQQESLILLLDDDTDSIDSDGDDDDQSNRQGHAQSGANASTTTTTSDGNDSSSSNNGVDNGRRGRLRRFLASGGDTTMDLSQNKSTSSNKTASSCERSSYTGLQCSFVLDDSSTSTKDTEFGDVTSVPTDLIPDSNRNSTQPIPTTTNETDNGGVPESTPNTVSLVSSMFPGSERRLLIACAGKTDEDVVLQASLDRSVASQCMTIFYSDDQASYYGGTVSTYLSVGQMCLRSSDKWDIDASSSKCHAGASLDAGPLKYCHASDACAAPQVCSITDINCPGFTCDMDIENVKETTGNADCILPVPGGLGDATSELRDTVTANVPFRDDVLIVTYDGLLSPDSPSIVMPDPNEILLSKKKLQSNYAIVWGSTSTCDGRMGPNAMIDCGSNGVVAVLDSKGADCSRVNASHVFCSSRTTDDEATVLVACGANDADDLAAHILLEEPLYTSNCSDIVFSDPDLTIYGGGTASYLTMGLYCLAEGDSNDWMLVTADSSCPSGRQYGLSDSDQSFCYSTGVCSVVQKCDSDGTCLGDSSCRALPEDIEMNLVATTATAASDAPLACSTAVGQNAGVSSDMWPLAKTGLQSGLSFIEGALSVSLSDISQAP